MEDIMFYVRIACSFAAVGGGVAGIAIMFGHVFFSVLRMMEGGK